MSLLAEARAWADNDVQERLAAIENHLATLDQ